MKIVRTEKHWNDKQLIGRITGVNDVKKSWILDWIKSYEFTNRDANDDSSITYIEWELHQTGFYWVKLKKNKTCKIKHWYYDAEKNKLIQVSKEDILISFEQ